MTPPPVFILGAGRAGRGLALALREAGVRVTGLHGRIRAIGQLPVTAGPLPPEIAEARVVILAVRDAQLPRALAEVLGAALARDAILLQMSGSADPGLFSSAHHAGYPCGTFHPLVALSDPLNAPALLREAWIGISGDPQAREACEELAASLGAHTLQIPDDPSERARYHAAAVIASNFLPVLLALATETMSEAGVPRESAQAACRSLMLSAAENLRHADPAAALTGPLSRGDVDTVAANLDALDDLPDSLEAYRVLSLAGMKLVSDLDNSKREELDLLLS